MRFGIAFIPGMPYGQVVSMAEQAEDLGYDFLFMPDQTFHRDPFVMLALCAQATQRITLGLAVTNPFTRHPVQIARGAGAVSEVAEGRFVLGLGVGNRPRLLDGLGIDATGPVDRIREATMIIRRLLAGETITYSSPTLQLNNVALDFEAPHRVPLYLGTRGPRMLALAGETADGVLMEGLFTPPGLDFALGQVETGARSAGRSLDQIDTVAWQSIRLGDDPRMAASEAARRWAALLIRTTQRDVLKRLGIDDSTISAVLDDAERYGEEGAGRRISPEDVVRLLMIGTPEQIQAQVRAVDECGVDGVACIVLGGYDDVRTTMQRFAREVMKGMKHA